MTRVIETSSKIDRVEVFRTRALVTRRAEVDLAGTEGACSLRLAPLPFLLTDDSVRLTLDDPSGLRVVDIHLELQLGLRGEKSLTEAAEKLRNLARQRQALIVNREREIDKVRLLHSVEPAGHEEIDLPRGIAFSERDQSAAWRELREYVRAGLKEHWAELRRLDRRLEELDDEINEANREVELESQAAAEELSMIRKAARISLEIDKPRPGLRLELSYLVPAARWVPDYELRVDTVEDRAELVCKALVAQRSGEDWPGVGLSFSSCDLTRSSELPQLDSWRIGKAQPPRATGWRDLPDTLDELFADYDRERGSLPGPDVPALPELPRAKRLGPEIGQLRRGTEQLEEFVAQRVLAKDTALPVGEEELAVAEDRYAEIDEETDEDYFEEGATPPRQEMEMMMEAEMVAPEPPPAPAKSMPRAPAMKMRSAPARVMSARADMPSGRMAKKEMAMQGGGAYPEARAAEMQLQPGVEASDSALSFGNLRMQGPDAERGRGQLLAASGHRQLAEKIGDAPAPTARALRAISADGLISQSAAGVYEIESLDLPAQAVDLQESAGNFATRYAMESPGRVPADGQLHSLTLLRKQGAVDRIYRCVPLVDDTVYQVARFENPLRLALLAGAVRVFSGGDFVVTAGMGTTAPGRPIEVNLGVEPGISVARNVKFEESTSGLLGGDTELVHRVEIDVHNKLGKAVRVELIERVPTSHVDDMEIKLLESRPEARPYDQSDRGALIEGGLKFSVELPAGEKKRCSFGYRITIPSKQVLVGGNRRE